MADEGSTMKLHTAPVPHRKRRVVTVALAALVLPIGTVVVAAADAGATTSAARAAIQSASPAATPATLAGTTSAIISIDFNVGL
jgi:hypothetical protein